MDDDSMTNRFSSFQKGQFYKGESEDEKTFRLFEQCLNTRQFHFATALAKRFTKSAHETYVRKWLFKRELKRNEKAYERDETLLHYIINFPDTGELLYTLLQICPDLAYIPRTHPDYFGQTPLHIAIASGNREAFDIILKKAWLSSHKHIRKLVNVRATGTKFQNTVMMGELPLFVAALRNDQYMVKVLIKYGAVPYVIKGNGDTVFHILIQYAALYRDKVKDVRKMMSFIHGQIKNLMEKAKQARLKKKKLENKFRDLKKKQQDQAMLIQHENGISGVAEIETRKSVTYDYRHVWFIKNNQYYTPLELAAKHGLTEIFNDILNLQDVYCHLGQRDGLFDEKSYDITEIDTIAKYCSQRGVDDEGELQPEVGCATVRRYPKREAILQMMCSAKLSFSDVAALIDLPPIKLLIKHKWHFYRIPYIAWMIFHYAFVLVLSAFAVNRSEVVFDLPDSQPDLSSGNSNASSDSTTAVPVTSATKERFVAITRWILVAIAIVYLIIGMLETIMKIRKPNAFAYTRNNLNYLGFIYVISVGIITDAIMHRYWYDHDGIPIVLAVLAAWWFNAFFLGGWRLFGFFTTMIQRVVFGDFFRFSVIIALQLFSFTTTMTVVYQDKNTPAIDGTEERPGHRTTFLASLFKMFKLMIGITELLFLDQTKQSWLAYSLYVLFILTTYILLINALIAMMSSTCARLLRDRYSQWRVKQLSVIIFLEDLLSLFSYDNMTSAAGGDSVSSENVKMFNPSTGTVTMVRRYYLKMSSAVQDYSYHDIAETASVLEKRDELAAECATNENVIQNMKDGIIAESEPAESVMDDYTFWDLSSAEESDTDDSRDPLRYYTIYHEFSNKSGELEEDTNSDADSTESRLRKLTKMASRGRIISYPRKANRKVMSLET